MRLYPFPTTYGKKASRYKVWADGKEIDVYSCDVSAFPLNRVWPGKQRDKSQTEPGYFVMLGANTEIELEIEPQKAFDRVVVRPLSKEVTAEAENKKVKVKLPSCGQYSIEFGGMHDALLVFVNPEQDFGVDKASSRVLYFGHGVHIMDERIQLKDNQTVFIDEGAVLYGSINAKGKKNIRVVGYGILDNSRMKRANEINGCAILDPNAGADTGNPIFFDDCENVVIDGITIVNSSGWNIYLDGCRNILVNNIKLMGQWRYNADGCDFCNCTNGIIQNSFLRTFDDCITVKGFKINNHMPIQNILAQNCVLWCDWGKCLEVGAETCAPHISGITFRDCDVIHGNGNMMDIQQGDGGDIENVRFQNIRLEYTGDEMWPVIQTEEEQDYPCFGKKSVPPLLGLTAGVTMWSIDDYCGSMRDIYFKDIKITADEDIVFSGGMIHPDENFGTISNVYLENFTLNGKKLAFNCLGITVDDRVTDVFCDGNRVK